MKHWQDFLHRNTVLFILCILSNQGWGQSTNENFEILYKHLIEIPDSNFVSRGDSLIEKLYLTNLQNHEHDSLISAILLENFHRKRTKSTFGEFLDLTRKTENLLLKLKVIPNQYLADLHYQFVVAFNHFQIRDSAEHHRTLMNGYINRIKAPNQLVISLAYENAKQAYFAGDYTAQLAFLNNGLDYLNKHFPDEIMTKLNFLNGIGIGYRRSHQYQKAVRHHEETLNFIEKNQEKVPKGWVGNVLNNLGLCHNDLGHFPQAIHFMKEALSAYQILGPNYQDQIGTEYANIAKAYADWGHPDSAIYYNLTSLKYMRETFGPEYYDQLLPLSNLSSNYLQKGNLAAADSFSNQGIDLMKSLGWSRLSPDGDYYLDDGLAQLANRLEIGTASFNQSGNISDLEKVVNYGKDYIATVNHAFHGLENSPSKEIFQKFHSPLFSIAIDNLYTLYEHTHTDSLLEIALNYIEQYKSLEIYYAVQKDNIGDDPVFRELNLDRSRLQDSIKWLESQLIQTSGDPIIRKSLDRFTQQLYQWQKMVRTSYPEYFLLVYQPDRIHLATLQKKIGAIDQSILTYHVADSFIYVMLINSDQVFFKRIKVETPVSESISSLRNNVFAYFLSPERSEELYELYATAFVEESVHLYDILLKPIDTNLRKKVTIIPDKSLGYLSFAPLLAKPPENPLQFKRHAYFIRDHVIAYNYSVHLIFESNANTKRHNNQLLAVAPSYKSSTIPPSDLAIRAGLSPLTYNEAEVLSINDRLGGDHLLGDQATKSTFLSYAPNYNILHLAMHSKANDEFGNLSYLAFSNVGNESFRLSASEIYALHLNCDLVTLSACETGLGELQEGEGIIGLARAFFIAGARSIVSTLWTVNDHSTATIMSSFYQNLGKNKSKDVALQQAQLTYLQDVDHLGAHPFFWSGYQAVGNMSSLKKTIYSRYIIFILFISVLLIGGRWIWSRISFSTGQ